MKHLINKYSGFIKIKGGALVFPSNEYSSLSKDIAKLNICDSDNKGECGKKLVIKPIRFNF